MVKIQLELSENEDRLVELYKLSNKLKTKKEAIKRMLQYFEVEVKPKKVAERDYYKV